MFLKTTLKGQVKVIRALGELVSFRGIPGMQSISPATLLHPWFFIILIPIHGSSGFLFEVTLLLCGFHAINPESNPLRCVCWTVFSSHHYKFGPEKGPPPFQRRLQIHFIPPDSQHINKYLDRRAWRRTKTHNLSKSMQRGWGWMWHEL